MNQAFLKEYSIAKFGGYWKKLAARLRNSCHKNGAIENGPGHSEGKDGQGSIIVCQLSGHFQKRHRRKDDWLAVYGFKQHLKCFNLFVNVPLERDASVIVSLVKLFEFQRIERRRSNLPPPLSKSKTKNHHYQPL